MCQIEHVREAVVLGTFWILVRMTVIKPKYNTWKISVFTANFVAALVHPLSLATAELLLGQPASCCIGCTAFDRYHPVAMLLTRGVAIHFSLYRSVCLLRLFASESTLRLAIRLNYNLNR